jgi:hypothetical protein
MRFLILRTGCWTISIVPSEGCGMASPEWLYSC